MPLFRKQQTTDGRGSVLVAEFTTGQAVMFLCAAIVFFGAAFVMGRLVARVDRPISVAAQTAVPGSPTPPDTALSPGKESASGTTQAKTGPTQTYTISAMEAGTATPAATQPPEVKAPAAAETVTSKEVPSPTPPSSAPSTSPPTAAPEAAPVAVQEAPPAAAPAPSAPAKVIAPPPVNHPPAAPETSPLAANSKPRLTELPPLPVNHEPSTSAPIPVEKPATPDAAPVQVASAAPAPAAQGQIVAMDPPPSAESAPKSSAPPAEAAAKPKAPPAADSAAPPAKKGTFAVQLGSFDGPQRQTKAQNLQKRVKKEYGLSATIENSEKDKLSRVVLTGYADKNAAAAACAGLRKKSGLSGAFVRAI